MGTSVNEEELFNHTSGRWLWNETSRLAERRRNFCVKGFMRLAAAAIKRPFEDVVAMRKLAEGGHNRAFLLQMNDGFQLVGRIPYLTTQPRNLLVASEVATLEYLQEHQIPVPRVFDYSTSADNPAGTEYIFMELMQGTNLADVWYDLSELDQAKVLTYLVRLEARLFQLEFPAYGSLYFQHDLPEHMARIPLGSNVLGSKSSYVIGPDLSAPLWYGKRLDLTVDRGPWTKASNVMSAGARKEIAYLERFGQYILPLQRHRRDAYRNQRQDPQMHIESLKDYLTISAKVVPAEPDLSRPTFRHSDPNLNDLFISDDFKITGLIDWQHASIKPLFLQSGVPNSLQNYGDLMSESLQAPSLPEEFERLDDDNKAQQLSIYKARMRHYLYMVFSSEDNPRNYRGMAADMSIIRQKLFEHSSEPWEGDPARLRADLIYSMQHWSKVTGQDKSRCPLRYNAGETEAMKQIRHELDEADEQYERIKDQIGLGSEGWVPNEYFEAVKMRSEKLKELTIDLAETEEEKQLVLEQWMFSDFDEAGYL